MGEFEDMERRYGCYAECVRQREEAEAYEAEQWEKRAVYCKENKAKLDAAGNRAMYFCEDCFDCTFYEDVGPTSWDDWGQDDVPHGICHLRETCTCPKRKEV